MMIKDYLFIDFKTYERNFLEALNVQTPSEYHALFYKKTTKGIEIYFSWNAMPVKTFITYTEINKIYENTNLNVASVVLSKLDEENPILKKFFSDYLFDRGIPLAEEI